MNTIIGKQSAAAALAALVVAMTATAATAGGHAGSGGHGAGTASGHEAQIQTREQTRSEFAERARESLPADAGLMSIEQIQARVRAEGYGDISEIERERAHYQVTARDRAGMPAELLVDATSGAILRVELDD